MSRLTSIAARHNVSRYDAEGDDLAESALRAAVISALVTRTNELFAKVEFLAPAKDVNLHAGEYRAAETALRFALVDLDALEPTLGEIAKVGEQLERETAAA
jgi:hypothetical protein